MRTYVHRVLVEGAHPGGSKGTFLSEVTTRETCVEALPRVSYASEVLFERLRIELRRSGEEGADVFDSAAPPPSGAAAETPFARRTAPHRLLAGSKITMVQRPSGLVERVEGVESLRERMCRDLAPEDPVRGGIERLLGLGSLRYLVGPNILVPEHPASKGEERLFQDIRPLPETTGFPGLLYIRGKARFAGVEDGVARIEIEAEATLDPGPNMPPWPPAMAANRNRLRLQRGVCTGWARISVEKGVLLEDEHRTVLDLHFVKPDGTGEVPLPTTVTQSTKLLK